MSIAAANTAPAFHHRRQLVAEDLRQLHDPCVLFEHAGTDADGVAYYLYTVGGVLHGQRLVDGCTVAGEVILVHADGRMEADAIACLGLADTITALDGEAAAYIDANAALARLQTVGPTRVMELAIKPDSDRSDEFERDAALIRPLIGDDIVLAAGRVEH